MSYFLLDANVVAAYYLARTHKSARVSQRSRILIEAVRSGAENPFFYIPNFCIAEVFSVFMKYRFGHWNRHLKGMSTIQGKTYTCLRSQFQDDIHNARLFYHYELSRYHVLGINLVAPVATTIDLVDWIPMRGRAEHLTIC